MSIITAPQYHLYHDGLRRDEERALCFLGDPMKFHSVVCTAIDTVYEYSNNQRLWGADDNPTIEGQNAFARSLYFA